ncbi:conserved hypothetical protein [Halobacteriovorax marinus SJ]|uniref:Amine oxidase domain-containing protein n=1 Tax=Halobacteriovorax marinus (strain ATCC BAA-682 / DSM 15412 / SJ) TaxID=862908 RepID=E1WX47_HALMS|nr:conserved hypothetical protein [Halobacteriovorax marinus SJ]
MDALSGASKILKNKSISSSYSPLIELSAFKGTSEISGDTPDEAHEVFWNKPGFIKKKGGLPKATETYDVVIVGGGLSGLASAYHLQDKKVLMLEGNPRLGGNARVEKYRDTYMSLGSAYVTVPEEGGLIESYFKDIGVHQKFKKVPQGKHPILYKGEFVDSFWMGATDKKNADEFARVYKRLKEIYQHSYPELPLIPGMDIDRKALDKLDNLRLSEWVRAEFGTIHPHIEEYFHQYCWSSFSTGYDEISAAQFLNFFTADLAGIQALPGGNGMIAVKTLEKMKNSNFTVSSNSFVADIREDKNGVYICYHDQNQKLKAVHAKKCIVTAPKLVAKHIIEGLDKKQHSAMDDMVYHAYLVANVLFKNKLEAKHYDIYSLIGDVPKSEYEDSKKRVFSDITYAHWANKEQAQRSAVTLYLPLPYAMAQQFLFSPILLEKYTKRIQKALDPFLKKSNKSWNDVEGIRLTRYGHAVAVAGHGDIASGLLERAHQPINNKIFFANQDNWANPCFETSYAVGTLAAFQATNRSIPLG